MRNLTTATYSPDGFGGETAAVVTAPRRSTGFTEESERLEVGRYGTDEDGDDGLTHGHRWAKTSTIR